MARGIPSLTIAALVLAATAYAGQGQSDAPASAASTSPALPAGYDGPPPPSPPEVMSRDGRGRTAVRAVRLDMPLKIAGNLDEAVYETVASMSDFIQQDPVENVP